MFVTALYNFFFFLDFYNSTLPFYDTLVQLVPHNFIWRFYNRLKINYQTFIQTCRLVSFDTFKIYHILLAVACTTLLYSIICCLYDSVIFYYLLHVRYCHIVLFDTTPSVLLSEACIIDTPGTDHRFPSMRTENTIKSAVNECQVSNVTATEIIIYNSLKLYRIWNLRFCIPLIDEEINRETDIVRDRWCSVTLPNSTAGFDTV